MATLTVQAVSGTPPWHDLEVEARVVTPDGSASFVIGEGSAASFPVGTEVHVKATDEDWFLSWMAEGSLLHGSADANDSFMLTQDTTVIGLAKGAQRLNYQHTDSSRVVVSVAGGDAPLELNRGISSSTRRYITVRGGTALSLTAESNNAGSTGLRVYGEYSQTSANVLSSSSVMSIGAPYVAISGGAAPYGTGTVMGTMANGQAVVDLTTSKKRLGRNYLENK